MQFFGKIKSGSTQVCIKNCQNIVTCGTKWRSRNPKFVCFPMEGLFGVVRPYVIVPAITKSCRSTYQRETPCCSVGGLEYLCQHVQPWLQRISSGVGFPIEFLPQIIDLTITKFRIPVVYVIGRTSIGCSPILS